MRRFLFWFVVSVWGLVQVPAVFSATNAELVDGVAAIVNDKIITYSDVRDYVQPIVNQLRRNYSGSNLVEKVRSARMDALNNLIERNLIIQEFKEKGFSFPDSVIDSEMNDVINNEFSGDRTAFIKTLQAENMTLSRYREQLRDRVIVQAMRDRKTRNEVVVSPYKIETYYKEHATDYQEDDQIKLRMIMIKKIKEDPIITTNLDIVAASATNITEAVTVITNSAPADTTNTLTISTTSATILTTNIVLTLTTNITTTTSQPRDSRRAMAGEILDKLDKGDSFESLAKLYTDKDRESGGEWGWVKPDELRKDLSVPAFKLKAGQHSQIIDTAEAYYILQVDDVRPAHARPLAEVRDEIERILLQQQRTKMQDNWVKQLRAKAYIRLF